MATFDPLDLPEELALVAKEELNETPDLRQEALDNLRQLISELPKDRLEDTSDANLIRFLRSKKFKGFDSIVTTVTIIVTIVGTLK